MEEILNFSKNNITQILTLITAIGTFWTAHSAYRSAKMSETANKAQFSPFIVPSIFYFNKGNDRGTQPNSFSFEIENRSEYKNAFAKNVQILINEKEKIDQTIWEIKENGSEITNFETIKSGQKISLAKKNIEIKDFVPGKIKISYEDILGNKFETICMLKNCSTDKYSHIDYSWEYKQK